jgi:large subunit ribosomal protein L25
MSINYELNAAIRHDMGKGASRRLRREKRLPGVIYGGGKEAISIVLDHDTVLHSLDNEAFYSHILNISVDGTVEKAVLKDLQRHPHKPILLHLDLQRVSETEKLRMHVPLHFVGEDKAPGVKQSGGVISHLMNDIEISCLPKDLPEYLEIDVSNLQLNEALHLSDIVIPEGVEIVELGHGADHDQPVVSIHMPRAAIEAEEVVSEEAAAEAEPSEEEEEAKPEEGESS